MGQCFKKHKVHVVAFGNDGEALGSEPRESEWEVLGLLRLSREDSMRLFQKYYSFHKAFNMSPEEGGFKLFCQYFKIDMTRFNKRCFSLVGHEPGDKMTIDFLQFVVCVWNLCTYDREGLQRFAFALFDTDRSGSLERKEVQKVVEEIYDLHNRSGATAGDVCEDEDQRVQDALRQIAQHSDEDGVMDLKAWVGFLRLHEMVLWPVFKMQRNIQEEIMGFSFWRRQAKLRRRITHLNGIQINCNDIDSIVRAIFGQNAYQALTGKRRQTGFWVKLNRMDKAVDRSLKKVKKTRANRLGEYQEEDSPGGAFVWNPDETGPDNPPAPPPLPESKESRRALAKKRQLAKGTARASPKGHKETAVK